MMYVPVTGPVAPVVQDVWLYVKLPNDDVPVPLAKPCSGSGAQAAFGPTDAVAVADPEKLMSTAEAGEAHLGPDVGHAAICLAQEVTNKATKTRQTRTENFTNGRIA